MWVIIEFDGELEGLPGHVWGPFVSEYAAQEAREEMQMEANDDYPIYQISEPPDFVHRYMSPVIKLEGSLGTASSSFSFTAIVSDSPKETTSE